MAQDKRYDSRDAYDVVVICGGPAGLGAALMLGRARRSVLVIDAGHPRNAPAAHLHGFLSRDRVPPAELPAAGRAEATGYGVVVVTGQASSAARDGAGFAVGLDGGRTVRALAMAPDPAPRSDILTALGVTPTAHASGIGAYIAADPTGQTPAAGVWVAGNVADPHANVLACANSGSLAAAAINADLIAEDTRQAVRAYNAPFSAAAEARICEQVMGDRRHGLAGVVHPDDS